MDLKHSIIETIAFFGLFEYPLTAEEVKEYLLNYQKPVHIKEIKGILKEMEPVVEQIHDYYVLKGHGKWVDTRKARKFISEKFWGRVRQYGQYVVRVPFVEMVAVCNNLSYDNATEQSDIDLFIVIREGRMWLARLLITLILQFYGVRRHGNKIAGRFCLSFFVTPRKLNVEPLLMKPLDPYLAYWTKLLMPIYGEKMYEKFKNENERWLEKGYGLKFSETSKKQMSFSGKSSLQKLLEWHWGGKFGNFLEYLLKKTFKKKTVAKQKHLGPEASVVVSDDMLKFHNHDRRKEYLERWQKTVHQALEDLKQLEVGL